MAEETRIAGEASGKDQGPSAATSPQGGVPSSQEKAARVLFLSSQLGIGGAERHLSILVPLLRERGFEPAVAALRTQGYFFEVLSELGIWTRFLPVRSRFDLFGIIQAVREVGRWPDVIVSQEVQTQVVGQLMAWRAGAAHMTVHHKQPEMRLSLHRRLLTRIAARFIDMVVAVSPAQTTDLVTLGFRADRIHVIENGVAEPQGTKEEAMVRSELGFADTDFVALLAARLRPEKRAGIFVDAVSAAHRHQSRIRGLVAGDGPDFEQVRARAHEGDAVLVLGEREDVADLIRASDVVCLTSRAEASPMIVLEAMALGKPVIAPGVGGIDQVVIDNVTGILTAVDEGESLADALLRLAADHKAAAAMGSAGRRRCSKCYSAEVMADRYAAKLRELLEPGSRRSGELGSRHGRAPLPQSAAGRGHHPEGGALEREKI